MGDQAQIVGPPLAREVLKFVLPVLRAVSAVLIMMFSPR